MVVYEYDGFKRGDIVELKYSIDKRTIDLFMISKDEIKVQFDPIDITKSFNQDCCNYEKGMFQKVS